MQYGQLDESLPAVLHLNRSRILTDSREYYDLARQAPDFYGAAHLKNFSFIFNHGGGNPADQKTGKDSASGIFCGIRDHGKEIFPDSPSSRIPDHETCMDNHDTGKFSENSDGESLDKTDRTDPDKKGHKMDHWENHGMYLPRPDNNCPRRNQPTAIQTEQSSSR